MFLYSLVYVVGFAQFRNGDIFPVTLKKKKKELQWSAHHKRRMK